jgi:hypothetical protein
MGCDIDAGSLCHRRSCDADLATSHRPVGLSAGPKSDLRFELLRPDVRKKRTVTAFYVGFETKPTTPCDSGKNFAWLSLN